MKYLTSAQNDTLKSLVRLASRPAERRKSGLLVLEGLHLVDAWLARQPPEALALLHLQPHPAARWQWCAAHPAYRLWQRQRAGLAWDANLPWQGEGALLTRPHDAVQWAPLPHAGCALLDACAAGATFEDAAAQALQADPTADLPALVALLLRSGALRAPETSLN